ncbi:MAG: BNR repeat-containing protein [Pirellulales bacterium]|nr:BNR repeat-containing protein [Pirellulales bacterium]
MRFVISTLLGIGLTPALVASESFTLAEDTGYRGIWYAVGPTKDEYGYKYSGGMATYPHQQLPMACYAATVEKTFFVYGGTAPGKRLLHLVSYFDHQTKTVPRPRILLDKETGDAHDNPVLAIDRAGHLWVFSNAHGTSRPAFIHRSTKPYEIDSFELVAETNFSYGQPWVLDDGSLFFMHTRYKNNERRMFWMASRDGRDWTEPAILAHVARGHYQISATNGRRTGTAFDYHPTQGGLDARTNIYYLESRDQGRTWQTVDGRKVETPLTAVANPALVRDYQSQQLLVYLKDLQFDEAGRPVILYLTSRGHEPGPANDPRIWRIAQWDGSQWDDRAVTTSDHNYDMGSLYLEADGVWRLIAPTDRGPQPYCTGGRMVLWTSADRGANWTKVKPLTGDPPRNHSYARRPQPVHPDFYAFWADGNALEPSESSLYFTDREGTHVWRLPAEMATEAATPEVAW